MRLSEGLACYLLVRFEGHDIAVPMSILKGGVTGVALNGDILVLAVFLFVLFDSIDKWAVII